MVPIPGFGAGLQLSRVSLGTLQLTMPIENGTEVAALEIPPCLLLPPRPGFLLPHLLLLLLYSSFAPAPAHLALLFLILKEFKVRMHLMMTLVVVCKLNYK